MSQHDADCEHQHPDPAVRAQARELRGALASGCDCPERAERAARKRQSARERLLAQEARDALILGDWLTEEARS